MSIEPLGKWDADLQCRLIRIEHDGDKCWMFVPAHNCVDMSGAIRVAQRGNPRVRVIRTVAGRLPDTMYICLDDGEWIFRDARWLARLIEDDEP